jgi:protein-L-isoaspartate(D-aspartate) O-methyltransferase
MEMADRRRFFAEELEAVCKLRSPALVDAFARVPREQYLPTGPWTVLADSDFMGTARTRTTPDGDPARVCHNIAVAIDPARQLFNGQPATLATWMDALELAPGRRVLHIGCGLGYYTAVMAEVVGPTGRVVAIDADPGLAADARRNLAPLPWVHVRQGDGREGLDEAFDAILVNAGVTHPLASWLDALAPGGRLVLPLTVAMPAMGSNIGKGLVMIVTREISGDYAARVLTVVAIYSAVGIRDESLGSRLGAAMMGGPAKWGTVTRLRRTPHEAAPECWLHGADFCFCPG